MKHSIKDMYELIALYKKERPDGHFFDDETLDWFGEKIYDMYLYKSTVRVEDRFGQKRECYAFSSLQKNHPCGPTRTVHYLDIETLEPMFLKHM